MYIYSPDIVTIIVMIYIKFYSAVDIASTIDHLLPNSKRDHALERALSIGPNEFQFSSHRPQHPPLTTTQSTTALVDSDDDRSSSNDSPSQ